MATLFEKIAAKKAAEALAAKEMATTPEQKLAGFMKEAEVQEKEAEAMAASVPEGKPLSFAEKMALKKAQTTASTSTENTVTAGTVKNSEKNSSPIADAKIPEAVVIGIVANVAEEEDHTAEVEAASPEDQQAYYDIKAKINLLSDMSEANLPGAMKELKTALLKNPQACYLILPQDIGQMVIALRAMKNEAVVEAASGKEKGPKKAKASKALTADEIAQAFDEL
jgi:hypothetical protein